MAIQHARLCGACERECPSWAHRCPACGSTAISYQMVIVPPGGTVSPIAADPRLRHGRARQNAPARGPATGSGLRTSA